MTDDEMPRSDSTDPTSSIDEPAQPTVSGVRQSTRRRVLGDASFLGNVVVALVALVSAGIGGAISGITSHESLQAQLKTERAQLDDQHATADREHRATVYKAFIDDANTYQLASDDVTNWLDVHKTTFKKGATTNLPASFNKIVSHWLSTRHDFQGSVNDVYVYGSPEAWSAASLLAGTMPPATGKIVIRAVTYPAYNDRYNDFLTVMCQELPAQPRGSC
ncbi:hypothetical protein AB0I55_29280 [Actinocatenispora sera]|uniref:hypothetical protein n=1 Tax=Actinocatenispora sera TaxID=390989 RepID=UPI0033F9B0D6